MRLNAFPSFHYHAVPALPVDHHCCACIVVPGGATIRALCALMQ
jgi:hypothetical protein